MMPPAAPMKSCAAFTPAATDNLEDETPQGIAETRDEALLEIMSGSAEEDVKRGVALQGVVDGLSKPRSAQIEKGHAVLERQGKTVTERLEGLVKLVANKLRTQDKN